ncbi:hypothetical protein J7394_09870 [Ruegeria sp. R13_0]|uniref:phosphoribosyltransferase-like protein n=1 Tax=Ruegeria sp. R13_0 TaxID=2821099 RepID=UPI001AD97EA3|nr:hypothetical protein [Ruegeria sp. R13_0]MBO9434512.1 hypothetical protein [Ruegeria sp. R13_0]
MPIDLTSPRVVEWLGQFDLEDQPTCAKLLSELLTVSADELTSGLRAVISEIAKKSSGPIALYAERHIRRHPKSGPNRMFKESRSRPRRAEGHGPAPVPPGRAYARETGSEGIIATLITGLVRATPSKFLDHPGPDMIRKRKVRSFVVVTDFIGSGKRASDNLEAAWKVRSFKSWYSSHHIRFEVAAYSGTLSGVEDVKKHRSKPLVHLHRGCPTIANLATEDSRSISEVCDRYGPRKLSDDRTALGYGDAGALIVFDHGIPNNAPLILHTKTTRWTPLFPRRSSSLLGAARKEAARSKEIEQALHRLREKRLAAAPRFAGICEQEQNRMLVLSALKRSTRSTLAVSARTGLTFSEVEQNVVEARRDGYLDANLRLTKKAYEALTYLRSHKEPSRPLPKTNAEFYCPKSLRPPRRKFG